MVHVPDVKEKGGVARDAGNKMKEVTEKAVGGINEAGHKVGHGINEVAHRVGHDINEANEKVAHKLGELVQQEWIYHDKPEYTKFDYQKEKGIYDDDVALMHTCTVNKKESFLWNEMMGLELGQGNDKTIVVTGMLEKSAFHNTGLSVGSTIFAINGTTDFESVEQAEQTIKGADELVTVICGTVKDGRLVPTSMNVI